MIESSQIIHFFLKIDQKIDGFYRAAGISSKINGFSCKSDGKWGIRAEMAGFFLGKKMNEKSEVLAQMGESSQINNFSWKSDEKSRIWGEMVGSCQINGFSSKIDRKSRVDEEVPAFLIPNRRVFIEKSVENRAIPLKWRNPPKSKIFSGKMNEKSRVFDTNLARSFRFNDRFSWKIAEK